MIKTPDILWTSQDAARATGGDVHPDWQATGVSINTRTLKPGDLFIALQGPNADGHDYVATAFEKGASAAAVCHRPPVLDPDAPLLVVDDTMQALEALGRAARDRLDHAKVIAVTGSVGKTGTKEALKLVLSEQGKTSASEGSLNNHWGLPLSLSRIPKDADYAVLELGMNHPGELTPLSLMARPHVCVITTIAPAHTEFFANADEIADAKAEIFKGAQPGATAVLNRDIKEYDRLFDAARGADMGEIVTFGGGIDADFRLVECSLHAESSDVTAMTPLGELTYRLGVPGRHWVMNSLCVLAAVHAAGGNVAQAAKTLSKLTAPTGRGQRFEIETGAGSFVLIDESYNASPAAMRAAMAVLSAQPLGPDGRRIAVLGDMLELGEETPELHAALNEVLEDNHINLVFLAGEAMEHLWKVMPSERRGHHSVSSDLLADVVRKAVRPGDVVMVKGSAGVRMGRVVEVLKSLAISKHEKGEAE
ncbi:UDP-N-acetylmuramoylalanyl-D-glutamyl-2,6-diaminopimelate--D-alanyl-D-alanine ligase [Magnetovibrio sp.]|uniref:UDP-N-acetylmuramoylalanyl-D-glutamyl-2, 6-diaminopimelate--D-alanyl-D-alanine ligase n=1 Tax=Magnetovibrio sp. TaxID=2024836 RepID=UPI002F93F985